VNGLTVLAKIAYQEDWLDVFSAGFMRSALIGGLLVAIAAGLLGYFVVVRQHAFAAHALAHIGFPGATGAVLIGAPVTAGLALFTIVGALAISLLGRRLAEREIATGTVLAFATGLGVLFNSMTTRSASSVTSVLFGNLLAISTEQLWVFGAFTAGLLVVLAVVARPLVFASVNPDVAEAKGVPVRFLGVVFMVALALVITMAVQVVGTLLLFGLVVTPAAAALAITARPSAVALLSTVIGSLCVVVGLLLSAMFNLPPSFVIVTLSFAIWLATIVICRESHHEAPHSGCATAPSQPTDEVAAHTGPTDHAAQPGHPDRGGRPAAGPRAGPGTDGPDRGSPDVEPTGRA
jgi:zinc/manganese transport system permease protein